MAARQLEVLNMMNGDGKEVPARSRLAGGAGMCAHAGRYRPDLRVHDGIRRRSLECAECGGAGCHVLGVVLQCCGTTCNGHTLRVLRGERGPYVDVGHIAVQQTDLDVRCTSNCWGAARSGTVDNRVFQATGAEIHCRTGFEVNCHVTGVWVAVCEPNIERRATRDVAGGVQRRGSNGGQHNGEIASRSTVTRDGAGLPCDSASKGDRAIHGKRGRTHRGKQQGCGKDLCSNMFHFDLMY